MSRYFLYGAGLFSFLSLPIPFAIRRSQTTETREGSPSALTKRAYRIIWASGPLL